MVINTQLFTTIILAAFVWTGIKCSGLLHKYDSVSVEDTDLESLEFPKIVFRDVPPMLLERYIYTTSYNNLTLTQSGLVGY